ncbi:MAG TPA: patatin-like phospholipase family protein [Nitrososphaeraceae archaeon]|jgi:predicted acylesterase/phospholipase RssA
MTNIPLIQRALVFQGGGALGAFQAGAFKALYEKLRSDDEKDNSANEPLFDIIAGTSIGAINAAILISYVLENKTWEGSAKRLEDFWEYISTPTPELSEALKQWRTEKEKGNASVASEEAARRYYSVKEFLKSGVERVFMPVYPPKDDTKFCDSQNKWLAYNNEPLRKSIERFAKFPISTSFESGEPRLLVISTDAAEGTTVTFDSYEKEQGRRETQYGDSILRKPIIIKYNEGIGIKHIMASSCVPEFYVYEDLNGRKFWDGGLLSNTPIKELFDAHKSFWERKIGSENLEKSFKKIRNKEHILDYSNREQEKLQRIPDLELYIVNLFNNKESNIDSDVNAVPLDLDGVKDRNLDINLSDGYDAKTDGLISDYVNLIERLISLGDNDESIKEKINRILDESIPRRYYTEEYMKNIDLLKNTFKIVKVLQINRKDDVDTVSGKPTDFTSETISKLIQDGYQIALSK